MPLARAEKRLYKTAEELGEIAGVNFWNADDWEKDSRIPLLQLAIRQIVIGAVVTEYTLIDDTLATVLCRYYLKQPGKRKYIRWRTKKFRVFVQYVLDEMYLLKKMEAIHAYEPLPRELREILRKLNAIRNALAHSFFPENRKEYRKDRKVLWDGKRIETAEGLQSLRNDCHRAFVYLARRAYRSWQDDWGCHQLSIKRELLQMRVAKKNWSVNAEIRRLTSAAEKRWPYLSLYVS
jgi:hypothetical protein